MTHPDMRRHFMTIPEAVQLILQAGAIGKGGEVFILDMGEPVSVLALAQDLIRLSGLEPERDIEIRFTGMLPGEKLFEELATDDERAVYEGLRRLIPEFTGAQTDDGARTDGGAGTDDVARQADGGARTDEPGLEAGRPGT